MGVGFAGCLFQHPVWVIQNWERPVGSATTAFQREGPSFPGELLAKLQGPACGTPEERWSICSGQAPEETQTVPHPPPPLPGGQKGAKRCGEGREGTQTPVFPYRNRSHLGTGGHPGVCRGVCGITPGCVGPQGGDKKEPGGAHRGGPRAGSPAEAARGGAAPPRVGAERSGAGGGGAALSCPHGPPRTHTHTHTRSHPHTDTHTHP